MLWTTICNSIIFEVIDLLYWLFYFYIIFILIYRFIWYAFIFFILFLFLPCFVVHITLIFIMWFIICAIYSMCWYQIFFRLLYWLTLFRLSVFLSLYTPIHIFLFNIWGHEFMHTLIIVWIVIHSLLMKSIINHIIVIIHVLSLWKLFIFICLNKFLRIILLIVLKITCSILGIVIYIMFDEMRI